MRGGFMDLDQMLTEIYNKVTATDLDPRMYQYYN